MKEKKNVVILLFLLCFALTTGFSWPGSKPKKSEETKKEQAKPSQTFSSDSKAAEKKAKAEANEEATAETDAEVEGEPTESAVDRIKAISENLSAIRDTRAAANPVPQIPGVGRRSAGVPNIPSNKSVAKAAAGKVVIPASVKAQTVPKGVSIPSISAGQIKVAGTEAVPQAVKVPAIPSAKNVLPPSVRNAVQAGNREGNLRGSLQEIRAEQERVRKEQQKIRERKSAIEKRAKEEKEKEAKSEKNQ